MILLIGSEKGGTGKTTIATNLAVFRQAQSDNVLLVDADPMGSANAWSALRELKGEERMLNDIICVQKQGPSIKNHILRLSETYEDIIIDTAGRDSEELRLCMGIADVILVPLQPSQFDMWAFSIMEENISRAKDFNPNLKSLVVANRVSTNPSVKEIDEMKEALQESNNLVLCETIIHERIAYRKAAKNGIGVFEMDIEDEKANKEIRSLYEEIYHGKAER